MVLTEKITISSKADNMDTVLAEAERFSRDMELTPKEALYIRLLAEETLGMVRGITGEYEGSLWFYGDEALCRVHLETQIEMDRKKRRELLATATSGKNMEAVGIMGKVREIMDLMRTKDSPEDFPETFTLGSNFAAPYTNMAEGQGPAWSLREYRRNLKKDTAAWDEMERSIVGNIADDVRVGIQGNMVEMLIEKHFPAHVQNPAAI